MRLLGAPRGAAEPLARAPEAIREAVIEQMVCAGLWERNPDNPTQVRGIAHAMSTPSAMPWPRCMLVMGPGHPLLGPLRRLLATV